MLRTELIAHGFGLNIDGTIPIADARVVKWFAAQPFITLIRR